MIKSAESALIQPIDRDYKRKGIVRQTHLEVKSDGTSYALRAGGQTMVLIKKEDGGNEAK